MKQEQVNLRQLVMEMLLAVTIQREDRPMEYSHVIIRDVLNKYNYLSGQEKAFMKRLFEGTLERMIELDYLLDQYSKVKVSKMKPVIRTIMRMSVYQILYMDAVPDSAACNEAAKLAGKKGFSTLKGFVNGVLRNIVRNKEQLPYPDREKDFEVYLSVIYSMPIWIVKLWIKQLGKEKTETLLKGLLAEHPVTIRLRNDVATDIEKALQGQGGMIEKQAYLPYAYRIAKTDDISQLPGYDEGAFVIQDVSSMLAIEALGIKPGMKILDICAAPGGKSMLAADKLAGTGEVEARDISEYKVALMQENFDRCGLQNVKAVCKDATQPDESWVGQADMVIADVPCSGLGVIGKKRDIKYKMNPDAIRDIIVLQEQILEQAVSYVKPGGLLLFSTCTINRDENEAHVKLLKDKYNMTPVSLDETLPEMLHSETTKQGYLQLLPGIHDTDGFFISIFKKG
ncbi:MAG: 16S rRNA (cytosine(967)-C(5))-methyltransferase RsmB [Lachnospiraceae bacterium]|nr:16S rRNA (cytosine(967)-C(5))-methyltransferase RsmB [Lachnospiraceae bacterium]